MSSKKTTKLRTSVQIDHHLRDAALRCRTHLPQEAQLRFASWSSWGRQLVLLGFSDFRQQIATNGWVRTKYVHSLRPNPLVVDVDVDLMEQARDIALRTATHPTALGKLRAPTASAVLRWALQRGVDIVNEQLGGEESS